MQLALARQQEAAHGRPRRAAPLRGAAPAWAPGAPAPPACSQRVRTPDRNVHALHSSQGAAGAAAGAPARRPGPGATGARPGAPRPGGTRCARPARPASPSCAARRAPPAAHTCAARRALSRSAWAGARGQHACARGGAVWRCAGLGGPCRALLLAALWRDWEMEAPPVRERAAASWTHETRLPPALLACMLCGTDSGCWALIGNWLRDASAHPRSLTGL